MSETLYEVELKFPINDPEGLRDRLTAMGAVWSEPVRQVDLYFGHPSRNFAETDEALRMRTVGVDSTVTYKGPVVDQRTKTRQEVEVELAPGKNSAAALTGILQLLGFFPVREVVKTRRAATAVWRCHEVSFGWDEVVPIGTFLELEIVTDTTGMSGAQSLILDLAEHLALSAPESRSYLEMLLQLDDAQRAQSSPAAD